MAADLLAGEREPTPTALSPSACLTGIESTLRHHWPQFRRGVGVDAVVSGTTVTFGRVLDRSQPKMGGQLAYSGRSKLVSVRSILIIELKAMGRYILYGRASHKRTNLNPIQLQVSGPIDEVLAESGSETYRIGSGV